MTSTGVIHQHGRPRCPGTGCQPVDGSVVETGHTVRPTAANYDVDAADSHLTPTSHQDFTDALKSSRFRVLKRIPKASRLLAANTLSDVLSRVINTPDSLEAWYDLLLFGHACFGVPGQRGGKRHMSSLASKVNKALEAFQTNTRQTHSNTVSQVRKKAGKYNLAARVSEKLEEGDVRGAIRLAASDDTLAPRNDETVAALRLKHPPRAASLEGTPPPPPPPSSSSSCLAVQQSDVIEAIKSFSAGSAGGIDGLRPQHLKDLISVHSGEPGQRLVSRLADFANVCLAGRVPSSIRPVFCGASLCALVKKDGGIRPIAVGCTLRRLVAKVACRAVREHVAARLAPIQLGFGIKQGTEAAAHAARRFLQVLGPGQALLKLDFTNAFNTLRRDEILRTVEQEIPELYPFVWTCYSEPTHLCFGDYTLSSEEGVQQGDPLGPLLFCVASWKLAALMKSEFNLWYLDDGTLGGDVATLLEDFATVVREGRNLGLQLNTAKCEVITSDVDVVSQFRDIAQDIFHVDPQSAVLLGAPIGGQSATDDVLSAKLIELRRLGERLKLLSAHDAFYLLKNCFSLPKLAYTLRCAPCYQSDLLSQYDDVIKDTLKAVLNIQLSDPTIWAQAVLPVASGGIGVRLATDVALPAFLSSVVGSAPLVLQVLPERLHASVGTDDALFVTAVTEWQARCASPSLEPPINATTQKAWDVPLVNASVQRLMSAAPTQAGLARLLAAASPHAGAFLQAVPCSSVGTRLDDTSLRIAIALRLGAPVCVPHTCVCGEAVDTSGTHGLSCRQSAGRHARHSAVNDLIKRALASADVPARLEPSTLSRDDGKRPDGLSTAPWKEGRCLVWDFTCPDTLAVSHLDRAVSGPGAVATDAESRKRSKYSSLAATYYFVPVAVETLGALGEEAVAFISDLGRRIAATTGEPRSSAFLFQRLSVAVQRGNAASVSGTCRPSAKLDDFFYL